MAYLVLSRSLLREKCQAVVEEVGEVVDEVLVAVALVEGVAVVGMRLAEAADVVTCPKPITARCARRDGATPNKWCCPFCLCCRVIVSLQVYTPT